MSRKWTDMSLELLSAHETDQGIAVTFVTERGLEPLEGTREEVANLARAMRQVSVLAGLNDDEKVWLERVAVGDAIVKLGLNPGRQARVHIVRRRIGHA
jgi:DNA-binding IclR family transcriptional regulator